MQFHHPDQRKLATVGEAAKPIDFGNLVPADLGPWHAICREFISAELEHRQSLLSGDVAETQETQQALTFACEAVFQFMDHTPQVIEGKHAICSRLEDLPGFPFYRNAILASINEALLRRIRTATLTSVVDVSARWRPSVRFWQEWVGEMHLGTAAWKVLATPAPSLHALADKTRIAAVVGLIASVYTGISLPYTDHFWSYMDNRMKLFMTWPKSLFVEALRVNYSDEVLEWEGDENVPPVEEILFEIGGLPEQFRASLEEDARRLGLVPNSLT
jgi:hypothetical protein